jgi:hypothetical protein
MSEILDAIGSVLQTAGVGTSGTTLFLSRMPETPDACVAVYESGAGYVIYTQGSTVGAQLNITNIQVSARGVREDYETPRTKITSTITALESVSETTVLGIRLLRIEQIGRPIPLGYDDNDRPRIVMNFAVTHG